jgi:hypothetical protein
MQAVETKGVTPVGAFIIMLSAFPVAGLICALNYHKASIFYQFLDAVPIMAVAGPIALFSVLALAQWLRSSPVAIVWRSRARRFSATIILRTSFAIGVVVVTALFLYAFEEEGKSSEWGDPLPALTTNQLAQFNGWQSSPLNVKCQTTVFPGAATKANWK